MTIIIPTKSSATSSMLDIWQSHIQQQQADKAQAAQAGTKPAGTANSTHTASQTSATPASGAAGSANATGTTNTSNPNGISEAPASDGVSQLGDKTLVDLRSVNQSAKDQGKAQAAPDAGAAGNDIASQTIKKLKEMLAKVMAQLDAVRNNDRLPPEEKLQQVNALSSQAMSIQAQILALMSPTGNHVDTTA
ncbi:hypothetical protein PCA20602_02852 [Pandoraea capi]|uniref:Uncharacterized protein n=1 Tax=Pandoraea capi TaxID=2508286 RepID=A0ABY6W1K6_9BURK|nr:hypothetical protein [Pandoraea capi]VVE15328.1 hypothetical protein PCA20602_02852 [Pandoraea capi]